MSQPRRRGATAPRTRGRRRWSSCSGWQLTERIPKKELAAYLNLSAETLSRLKQRGKI